MAKHGSPAKRGKKNSKLKRIISTAKYVTNDLYLVFAGGKRETYAIDKKSLTPVDIGPSIASSLHSLPFEWSVYLAVLFKRQDGQRSIRSEEYRFVGPYHRSLLENYLNEQHDKLIRTCNDRQIVNIGWIASTCYHKFDDKIADKLFDNQGAWDYLAKWEEDEINSKIPYQPKCPKCKRIMSKITYREKCLDGGMCTKCEAKHNAK